MTGEWLPDNMHRISNGGCASGNKTRKHFIKQHDGKEMDMSAKSETRRMANYIMAHVPGEPSRSEGAGECAVRLLKKYRQALAEIMSELGVPDGNYLAPVANAYVLARDALAGRTRVIEVVEIRTPTGKGTGGSPARELVEYYALDSGELLARRDTLDSLDPFATRDGKSARDASG